MACNFSIPFNGSPEQVLGRARSAVQGQGGSFTGDNNNGHFKVSVFGNTIEGTYSLLGQNLQINITDKPFLVSCGMIESYLKGQLK